LIALGRRKEVRSCSSTHEDGPQEAIRAQTSVVVAIGGGPIYTAAKPQRIRGGAGRSCGGADRAHQFVRRGEIGLGKSTITPLLAARSVARTTRNSPSAKRSSPSSMLSDRVARSRSSAGAYLGVRVRGLIEGRSGGDALPAGRIVA
jgi:hypothetical protein